MPEENRALVVDGPTERCQRWRKIAIEQLGYVLNLTLTFSIAALGYCFVLLRDDDLVLEYPAGRAMAVAMVALALSVILGFTCAVVRLLDFRGSARRACDHPLKPTKEAMR